jgi:hypothetical protein
MKDEGGRMNKSESRFKVARFFFILHPSAFILCCMPFVMIGDNQIDALIAHHFRLLNRSNAAIDRDDHLGSLIANRRECFGVEAISFVDAVGNVIIDFAAEGFDGVPENGGGGDAIDVVIAVDDDFFLIADGAGDALGGEGQVWDEGRVGQSFGAGAEEFAA